GLTAGQVLPVPAAERPEGAVHTATAARLLGADQDDLGLRLLGDLLAGLLGLALLAVDRARLVVDDLLPLLTGVVDLRLAALELVGLLLLDRRSDVHLLLGLDDLDPVHPDLHLVLELGALARL